MKQKRMFFLLLCFALIAFVGCAEKSQPIGSSTIKPSPIGTNQGTEIEKARKDVIDKFKKERDVLGTSKFIEDMYEQYPDDEIISTIYNYDSANSCYDYHLDIGSKDTEWLNKAKSYASKISPDYKGEFSDEIILFVSKLLGDEWQKIKQETLEQEVKFNKLSIQDKKEIKNYIQSRYNYYAQQEGGSAGDKYSDKVWQDASKKYGLSEGYISDIWLDSEITIGIAEYQSDRNNTKTQVNNKEPQKIVDSDGKQIWKIYVSSGKLHFTGNYKGKGNFIVKLSDSNQDLIRLIANEIGDFVSDKTVSVPYEGWYYLEVYGSGGSWEFNWQ